MYFLTFGTITKSTSRMKPIKHFFIFLLGIHTLFAQNNNLEVINTSTTSGVFAVKGTISTTTAGASSVGVRGSNLSTNTDGYGVWGTHSGGGVGVLGGAISGYGIYGSATSGYGVYGSSTSGTGIYGVSTTGYPAIFTNVNAANSNNVVSISTNGSGRGLYASSTSGTGIYGSTSSLSSAGVIGINSNGGEAIVGFANSNIAGAVVGRNDNGGYGVRGFVSGNNSDTGIGVYGQIGGSGSTGRAGRFENSNANNLMNTFEVYSNGNGNIPDNTLGNASSFYLNNTNSVGAAVRGEINSIFGNFGAAGIFGVSSGTGGRAGLFYASNPSGNGAALIALTDGNGNAITANAGKDGNGVETNIDGSGTALYAWVPSYSTGKAGRFQNFNEDNDNDVIFAQTVGNGTAVNAKVDNTQGTAAAVKGEVNSIFANFGTAAIYGVSSGTGGYAGLFHASNASGNGPAVIAIADGNGNAITANAANTGDGIESTIDGSGNAIYGWVPNYATGKAGRFENKNTSNGNPAVHIINAGTGSGILVNHTGSSGNVAIFQSGSANVARINKSGTGYFNGGTFSSGADVAELFDVKGHIDTYEAGDILVISKSGDRQVEKSQSPYSTLVAGVYATKPGVVLTEENLDSDLSGKVPMGVVGVIPTKVCLEGGPIERGDMLVTSSVPGVAMKADPDKVKVGQVLGKALQDFNSEKVGKINVLVNVK